MTESYIHGDGSSSNPLRPGPRTRAIIKALIAKPRAKMKEIHNILNEEDHKWPTGLTEEILDEGILGELLQYRVDIVPQRTNGAGGTCLVRVSLINSELWEKIDFVRAAIAEIEGVIEWDEVTGDFDFLVRVADESKGELTARVCQTISKLDGVHEVRTINVRRSGVVDRFEPEDFLCFKDL